MRHHPQEHKNGKGEPVYQAVWADNRDFDQVLISKRMVQVKEHILSLIFLFYVNNENQKSMSVMLQIASSTLSSWSNLKFLGQDLMQI